MFRSEVLAVFGFRGRGHGIDKVLPVCMALVGAPAIVPILWRLLYIEHLTAI